VAVSAFEPTTNNRISRSFTALNCCHDRLRAVGSFATNSVIARRAQEIFRGNVQFCQSILVSG
jgi:hypothetical protein